MYEALVQRLRKQADAERFFNGEEMLYEQAADAIEELQAAVDGLTSQTDMVFEETEGRTVIRFEPKWIPVTERLPEKREWVLCQCRANITDVLRFENAEWYHDPTHVYMYGFVTHWMPLPEPPKGENKDLCVDCRFYPPSSLDGKPCWVCDPSNPFMNCYDAKGET